MDRLYLIFVLLGSLCLNVYLGFELNKSITKPSPGILESRALSEIVPSAYLLSGNTTASRPVLVYVFSPSCRYCRATSQLLKGWSQELSKKKFRLIALATHTENLKPFLDQAPLPEFAELVSDLGFMGSAVSKEVKCVTPQILMFQPNGTQILKIIGAPTPNDVKLIEQVFTKLDNKFQ